MLPVILGKSEAGRDWMLEEAFTFALRQGKWKYIAPTTASYDWLEEKKNVEGGLSQQPQLYNLEQDPGEQHDLSNDMPEKVQEMRVFLEKVLE